MNRLLVFLLIFFSFSFASVMQINTGWTLSGTNFDQEDIKQKFLNCNSIWIYGDNGWQAESPNGSLNNSLEKASIPLIPDSIKSGYGFWVNCSSESIVTIDGVSAENTAIILNDTGWHLKSAKGSFDINVSEYFNNEDIQSVWKYGLEGWTAYSPDQDFAQKLTTAGIGKLETIILNEGFWVNSKNSYMTKESALVNPIVYVPTSTLSGSININDLFGKVLKDTFINPNGTLFLSPDNLLSTLQNDISDQNTNTPALFSTKGIQVDNNGNYFVKNLPSGIYTLSYISPNNKGIKLESITVAADSNVTQDIDETDLKILTSINILLDENSSVDTHIKINELNVSKLTDGNQSINFESIPLGTYNLTVKKEGFATKVIKLDINTTEPYTYQLAPLNNKICSFEGYAKIPGALNNANAVVYTKDADGSVFSTTTNPMGYYKLENLAFDSKFNYFVIAMAQDTKSEIDYFTLEQNITTKISDFILLEKNSIGNVKTATIQGYIKKNKEFHIGHEDINISIPGTKFSVLTQRDGSFIINDVPVDIQTYTLNIYYKIDGSPLQGIPEKVYDINLTDIKVLEGAATFIDNIYLDEESN